MVKNLPVMQETWVQSLGQEDPLEKGMATLSRMPSGSQMVPSRSSKLTPVFVTTPYSCLLVDSNFLFICLLLASEGFPGGSAGKESACNVGDLGSIPGSGRSPREGNSILQDSGQVHRVAKSRARLSDLH